MRYVNHCILFIFTFTLYKAYHHFLTGVQTKENLRQTLGGQYRVSKTTMTMATAPSAVDVIVWILSQFTPPHSTSESGVSE